MPGRKDIAIYSVEVLFVAVLTIAFMMSFIGTLTFIILISVMVCIFIATYVLLSSSMEGWVRLNDSGIVLDAPMAKLTIPFASISALELVHSFRPGLRVCGYGGINVGSGDFSNDTLGSYVFAGTTKVDPMIVVRFSQKGRDRFAAFNLADEASTVRLYESIRGSTDAGSLGVVMSPSERESVRKGHSKMKKAVATLVVVLLAFVVIVVALSMGAGSVNIDVQEDRFTVDAPMVDKTVYYEGMTGLEIRDHMDFGVRVGGLSNTKVHTGNFENSEFGRYKLAINDGVGKYIVVHNSGNVLVFNSDSESSTMEIYEKIRSYYEIAVSTSVQVPMTGPAYCCPA